MLKPLILSIFLIFHPAHVTLTSIDQVKGSDSLKVFFRMYYDDFLRDYRLYDPKCNLEKISGDQSFPPELLNKYFNEKVHIYVNNKLLIGKLLNVSIRYNEVCMNLLFISDKNPKKIKIRNKVLIRLYSDQTNMIFIHINKFQLAMRLTPKHIKETYIMK
jgi:hypothetical protein